MTPRRTIERELRKWLRAHHSVIGYSEALAVGAPRALIRAKGVTGEWDRVYRGVFRDTSAPPTGYQALRAAFVATGGHGVVSHESAGWLWGLCQHLPAVPELSVRTGTREVRVKGIIVHKSRDLDLSRSVTRHGIPATDPFRTLIDLAGSLLPPTLADAVDAAVATRLVTVDGLTAELQRLARRGRPGVEALRRHLVERGFIGAPAPSVLEARMRRLISSLGIPLPRIELQQGDKGQYRLDFSWPEVLLVVEVDGYVWHFTPEHKRRDDNRRNHLQAQGWTVLVFNWVDVSHQSVRVGHEIVSTFELRTAAHRPAARPPCRPPGRPPPGPPPPGPPAVKP